MKKLLIIVSIFMVTISLSACDLLDGQEPSDVICQDGFTLNDEGQCIEDEDDVPLTCDAGQHVEDGACVDDEDDPLTCETGQHVEDGACVDDDDDPLTCPAGQHVEDGTCVVDPLVCNDDYHEEDGACVPDEGTELYRSMVIDAIIDQMDNNPQYLGMVMQDMTFSQGMEITYEVDLEATEDEDEVHTFHAVITDTMVGNMVQRELYLEMDEEIFEFAVYYETVETGVKVYLQPGVFVDALRMQDPDAADIIEWVGFDSEWAVFEFDESLENMIQLDILQDMVSAMFFDEMGALYFYEVQERLEQDLGIDLNEYGIDLGLLVDDYLDENYDGVNAALEAIDAEGLVLHIDALYIAPELFNFLSHLETELRAEGFAYDTLMPLLDTAEWVYDELEDTEELTLKVALDGNFGTEAFLNALTEADKDAFVEVLKGEFEISGYHVLKDQFEIENYVRTDFYNMIMSNEAAYVAAFSQAEFDRLSELLGETQYYWYNFDLLWNELTPEERMWFENLGAEEGKMWIYDAFDHAYALEQGTNEFISFLVDHSEVLTGLGYDVSAIITEIETSGIELWFDNAGNDLLEPIFEAYVYTFLSDLDAAFAADNGLEFMMNTIFSNPHVVALFDEAGVNPLFDAESLAANMVLIDWNVIGTEMLPLSELATAVYEGPVAFEAFLTAQATMAPNQVLLLELFTPAVETAQPLMMYVDEIKYGIEGLEVFEDYIDPQYYLDNVVDFTTTNTDDTTLLLELEIDGLGYATLFDDVFEDLNTYMMGYTLLDFPYDEAWACIEEGPECEDLDLVEPMTFLMGLESSFLRLEMDPSNQTWVNIELDVTDLFNGLATDEYQEWLARRVEENSEFEASNEDDQVTGFNAATITVMMKEVATMDTPAAEDTVSVNEITEDFGRFLVSMEGYNILEQIYEIYNTDDGSMILGLVNNPTYLNTIMSEYGPLEINGAFDAELSYVVVTMDYLAPGVPDLSSIDYELHLYWIDEVEVFTEPLGLTDLMPLILDDNVVSEAAYDYLVSYPNEETFGLTRVWLILAMQEDSMEKAMEQTEFPT